MTPGFAACEQVAREALGYLDHVVFEGAMLLVQPPVRISPEGRDVVGGERIAVGDGATVTVYLVAAPAGVDCAVAMVGKVEEDTYICPRSISL